MVVYPLAHKVFIVGTLLRQRGAPGSHHKGLLTGTPYTLLPIYWLLDRLPATREIAHRLELVTLDQAIAESWDLPA